MKNALNVSALVLVALVASARPAHANFWDWMQEWSGPGPFTTNGRTLLATFCPGRLSMLNDNVKTEQPCVFVDWRDFKAAENDNFPIQITTDFVDIGLTWRLGRAAELGIGAGFMVARGSRTATRFTVTAPRAVVKPILLFGSRDFWKMHDSAFKVVSVLKAYARTNMIAGRLNAEHLGVSPSASDYARTNEFVPSYGLLIDLGELFLH